ncbi:Crp/Fnr family transcriptional regulator [Sphingomonas mali]|uniref:Crp/Fnr family transcriptional regulator n=1 Tax=Sphingomonas mali TaxID=40682 RepID=UPI001C3F7BD8|nr:Crp/Fnr family transcriptional regulator [Sphingomonas mali]
MGLSKAEIAQVVAKGIEREFGPGSILFTQDSANDGVYLIASGRVRVYYTAPSGREITLALWHAGNFVGGPEIFGGGLNVWSGMASTRVSALHLPGAALRELALGIPHLAIGIIEGLTFKGKCYSAMAQMLGTRSVTERLAHMLLHLSDLYGLRQPGGTLISTKFTHEEIAHMVGATRQWVTASLKRFHAQGILSVKRGNITVVRADILDRIRTGAGS